MSVSPFTPAQEVEEVEEVEPLVPEDVPWEPKVISSPEDVEEEYDGDDFEIPAEVSGSEPGVPENIAGVSRQESFEPIFFEGHAVSSTELQVALKVGDLPRVTIDDRVRIIAEIHVRDVLHKTDGNGDIVRIVKAKQLDASVTPWVEGEDDGVIRGS